MTAPPGLHDPNTHPITGVVAAASDEREKASAGIMADRRASHHGRLGALYILVNVRATIVALP